MTAHTYELCFDPRDGSALVYRNVPAGVCGPFSEPERCESREHAERMAREKGYLVVGDWRSHANYDSAELVRSDLPRSQWGSREWAALETFMGACHDGRDL